jgi:hypothetical protein
VILLVLPPTPTPTLPTARSAAPPSPSRTPPLFREVKKDHAGRGHVVDKNMAAVVLGRRLVVSRAVAVAVAAAGQGRGRGRALASLATGTNGPLCVGTCTCAAPLMTRTPQRRPRG